MVCERKEDTLDAVLSRDSVLLMRVALLVGDLQRRRVKNTVSAYSGSGDRDSTRDG